MRNSTRKALVGWACTLCMVLAVFTAMLAIVARSNGGVFWWVACIMLLAAACFLVAAVRCVVQECRFQWTSASMPRVCLGCRYSLRSLREMRCPECGLEFNPDDPNTFDFEAPTDLTGTDARLLVVVCLVAVGFICIGMIMPLFAR